MKDAVGKPYRYLVALDPSKGKEIWLRVPPDMETPKEAEAWTYSLGRFKMSYEPDIRT